MEIQRRNAVLKALRVSFDGQSKKKLTFVSRLIEPVIKVSGQGHCNHLLSVHIFLPSPYRKVLSLWEGCRYVTIPLVFWIELGALGTLGTFKCQEVGRNK